MHAIYIIVLDYIVASLVLKVSTNLAERVASALCRDCTIAYFEEINGTRQLIKLNIRRWHLLKKKTAQAITLSQRRTSSARLLRTTLKKPLSPPSSVKRLSKIHMRSSKS